MFAQLQFASERYTLKTGQCVCLNIILIYLHVKMSTYFYLSKSQPNISTCRRVDIIYIPVKMSTIMSICGRIDLIYLPAEESNLYICLSKSRPNISTCRVEESTWNICLSKSRPNIPTCGRFDLINLPVEESTDKVETRIWMFDHIMFSFTTPAVHTYFPSLNNLLDKWFCL